jgi:hypothetical protein
MKHTISLETGYYASLCWFGLKQLGLLSQEANPAYAHWAKEFSKVGSSFGFRAPLSGGPLFRLLYQMPGDINPATPEEMRTVLQACQQIICDGSLAAFTSRWPAQTRHWPAWYHAIARQQILQDFSSLEAGVSRLLEAWADFLEELWPDYQVDYAARLQNYPFSEYQQRCARWDLFTAWREELGVEYPYTDFTLVICPENPSLASSLGPQKVVIGSRYGWDAVRHTIIHEVGVRYASLGALAAYLPTARLLQEDYFGLLKVIEAEICYRKPRLMPELTGDVFAKGMNLEALIAWRSTLGDASPILLPETIFRLYQAAREGGYLKMDL